MTINVQEIYDAIDIRMCGSCQYVNQIAQRDEANMIYFTQECGVSDVNDCPIVKMNVERLSPE